MYTYACVCVLHQFKQGTFLHRSAKTLDAFPPLMNKPGSSMGARKEGNLTGHKLDRGDPRGCVATIGEDYYIAHEVRRTNGEQGDMENHGKPWKRQAEGISWFSIFLHSPS